MTSPGNEPLRMMSRFSEWLQANYEELYKRAKELDTTPHVLLEEALEGLLGPRTVTIVREILTQQDICVDVTARKAWKGGEPLQLTRRTFEALVYLMRHAGRAVPRDSIIRDVWGTNWVGHTKTLDQHMTTLRRALSARPEDREKYIATVRGVGFRFNTKEMNDGQA